MSGTTDLLSVAQTLTGDLLGGTTPGRLSAQFVGTNLSVSVTPASGDTPASYDVTAEGIYGGSGSQFRLVPAYEFTNARDVGGVTLIDVQTVNRSGQLTGVTTFNLVAVDQDHVLLFNPAAGNYIILADNDTLNPNAPDSAFPTPNNTGNLVLSQTTANGVPFTCFVAGAHVKTINGDVLVEAIRVGDMMLTADGPRPVTATLSRRVRFNRQSDAELALPVRILAGAFDTAVPERDLLVSPDHAIFVDGMLVAARRLINGSTILIERLIPSVRYVHIELAEHGVLFAEGLATESYLDCGKRAQLDTGFDAISLVATAETTAAAYAERGCAPLATDPEVVRPLWERLAARAAERGLALQAVATTTDAELQVIADGVALERVAVDGATYRFALPAGVASVRIVSRSARPTDAQPWLDDRRTLGVAIGRIEAGSDVVEINDAAAAGWHAAEADFRWTNGDAVLNVPASAEARVLSLTVVGSMTYALPATELARAA